MQDLWKKYSYVMFGLMVLLVFWFYDDSANKQSAKVKEGVTYSEFLQMVDEGDIYGVIIQGQELFVTDADNSHFKLYGPSQDGESIEYFRKKGVVVEVKPNEGPWYSAILGWLPLIILIGVWIYFMRRMQSGGSGKKMTKSMARTETPGTRFADVAGVDEALAEVEEIVEFLKEPEKFTRLGAKIPKGILLVGLPGTGKTLLARAIAGEAGVRFFSMSGSEFVEMFVGVGASRVRSLFTEAKKNTPCIIFVDEIDAMGKSRGAGVGQTHNEGEQTLNQLFVEMDGFEVNQGIILLAATNRPDVLDPALLRPGRFDRQVEVSLTDIIGRVKILEVHTRDKVLSKDVDLHKIARAIPMYSGARIEKICNEAAILASRKNKDCIEMEDFWGAKEREQMGLKRGIHVSEDQREITAYHEAGHALVGLLVPGNYVDKVTIIPHGRAMGVTSFLPEEDQYFYTKKFLLAEIKTGLGGRIAEEVVFGKDLITTGAHGDLISVTGVVRRMVCDWGMSEDLPLRSYGERHDLVFLGRELGRDRDYGEDLANKIDQATQKIIDDCTEEVRIMIKSREEKLRQIAQLLLEKEAITGDEVKEIILNNNY